jgi:hypothetical protein
LPGVFLPASGAPVVIAADPFGKTLLDRISASA